MKIDLSATYRLAALNERLEKLEAQRALAWRERAQLVAALGIPTDGSVRVVTEPGEAHDVGTVVLTRDGAIEWQPPGEAPPVLQLARAGAAAAAPTAGGGAELDEAAADSGTQAPRHTGV